MAISLTDAAADRVRAYLEKRDKGLGLRLGVTKTVRVGNLPMKLAMKW